MSVEFDRGRAIAALHAWLELSPDEKRFFLGSLVEINTELESYHANGVLAHMLTAHHMRRITRVTLGPVSDGCPCCGR